MLSLSPEETRHFRASLRNLRHAFGSWSCLAEVIGVRVDTLKQVFEPRRRPSGVLVLRAAQAAGMSVEALLTGRLNAAGRCPTCHTTIGHRADRRAS